MVRTNHPIQQILRKSELAERMIAWLLELSEFDIKFELRWPVKAYCLEDFIAELMTPMEVEFEVDFIC